MLLQSKLKRAIIFHETVKCLSFNVGHVLYVLLEIKCDFMRFADHCVLFLFMFYTTLLEMGLYLSDLPLAAEIPDGRLHNSNLPTSG